MNWFVHPLLPIELVSAGIFLLLSASTVFIYGFGHRFGEKTSLELKQRLKSWWFICVFFLGAVLSGGSAGITLFLFISYLAFKEYSSLIPTRQIDRRALFWGFISIPLQYTWIYLNWYGMFIIFIPVFMFLILPMRLVSLQETKGFLNSAGKIHWGLMITVFCLSHAAWMFTFPLEMNPQGAGAGWVLYLVGLTELNDIAQYLWGKALGNKKILPEVSPGKTWAGFWGGVCSTSLLSFLFAPLLTPFSGLESIVLGAAIAAFGFLGDVTVSAVKRDLDIKDCGGFLPGHGGILDRVDSLLFTAPLFVHYLRYYHS